MSISTAGWTRRKIHRRHQTLPAGEEACVLAVFGLDGERFFNGAGGDVAERGGFHGSSNGQLFAGGVKGLRTRTARLQRQTGGPKKVIDDEVFSIY
jgi:hypothetical protein